VRSLCLIVAWLFPTFAIADEFFETRIAPVLREHCFPCHSHEAGKMKGGLTLDSRSGWAQGGDSGGAITPGKPADSLLLEAMRHESFEMPPDYKLPAAVLDDFEQWIALGADDPRTTDVLDDPGNWWSLRPLVQPQLSEVAGIKPTDAAADLSNVAAGSHPIDRFVLAGLTEQQLTHSPPADRRTLIRRLTIDLHGLQPTPEAVADFVADAGADAYERLVDRLLASPRYGERWARHWMDTIHFADSHGFEHDVGRDHAWPFRDYLIEAFNADKTWMQFTREQLAADTFYPDQVELTAALGFLGAGTFDLSTFSTAPVTFDYLDRDDLVSQTTAAFLSTTASCARCHDHKFDPIPQEDYYALQAVFAGVLKGVRTYDRSPSVHRQRQHLQTLVAAAKRRDEHTVLDPEHRPVVEAWEAQQARAVPWQPLRLETFHSTAGARLTLEPEGYLLASGTLPEVDTAIVTGTTELKTVSALRLELFPHESLPMRGPGRCENGNLHLSEFEVQLFEPQGSVGKKLTLSRATADFEQAGWLIAHALDGNDATAWGIHPRVGERHHAVFQLAEPIAITPESRWVVSIKQLHGRKHLLGAFGLSVTDASAAAATVLPAEVTAALAIEPQARTSTQQAVIASHALEVWATVQLSTLPELERVYAAGSTVEVPGGEGNYTTHTIAAPKVVHLLQRGDFDKPQSPIEPGALSLLTHAPPRFALPLESAEAARRAALADWIVHSDNALAWRSVVNRVWSYHFGRGLCSTPNDFGRMGDSPLHPALLDWLAVWFRDEARGSLKQLHRLLVTSATYRQQSTDHPLGAAVDSDNRRLWRQNRLRLDADSYRDALLVCSDSVDLAMGGPAIEHFAKSKGPQLTPTLTYENYDWGQAAAARRSIYRCVWRGLADPFMESLDFPDLGLLAPVRSESTSALQALTLYNHDFVLHHSAELARRVERERPASLTLQVRRMVEIVWLRPPREDEAQLLATFAKQYGLAALARALLNSNEFLFVD